MGWKWGCSSLIDRCLMIAPPLSGPRRNTSFPKVHVSPCNLNLRLYTTRTDRRQQLRMRMEPSPLTRDSRPEVFQPKIIRLYETLFKVCLLPGRPAPSAQQLAHRVPRKTMTTTSTCPTASGTSFSCTGQTRPASSTWWPRSRPTTCCTSRPTHSSSFARPSAA
jgi:hypothetical protein